MGTPILIVHPSEMPVVVDVENLEKLARLALIPIRQRIALHQESDAMRDLALLADKIIAFSDAVYKPEQWHEPGTYQCPENVYHPQHLICAHCDLRCEKRASPPQEESV